MENKKLTGFLKVIIREKQIERQFECNNICYKEDVIEFYNVEFISICNNCDGFLRERKYSKHIFRIENIMELKM